MQHRDEVIIYQTLLMEDVFYTVKQDFPLIKSDLEKILESET